jgi:hypothetical protein
MPKCPICRTENDEFATVCQKCGSFLRNRVPNLNLFETLWGILESPRKTFETIVIAEHKNFSLLLFTLFGISMMFTAFWFYRLGIYFSSLPELLMAACALGTGWGILVSPIIAFFFHRVAQRGGRRGTFRTGYAILAYATTPVVLSLVFILPVELLTFGMYFFTHNPHPYVIKPLSYVLLLAFDGIAGVWALWLAVRGTTIAYGTGLCHALTATAVAVGGVLLSMVILRETLL